MLKKNWLLLKRFGLYLFIPVFLYLAYNYIASKDPQYKVSAKIALKGISRESAIEDIKSKNFIGKALDQLPFQASYYYADLPKQEIYPDSSPVILTFNSISGNASPVWLSIQVPDNRQFMLSRGDTSEFYKFNEPVKESYGAFTVTRNAAINGVGREINVKIVQPATLANQFYNDLTLTPDHDNEVLKLTVVTGNPNKGVAFLNTLFNLYGETHHAAPVVNNPIKPVQTETIVKPDKDIAALKDKTTELKKEIDELKVEASNSVKIVRVKKSSLDKGQLKIYEAVDGYVKKPIGQFVQVPYVDEIEDPDLNDQVSEFNETELARQHLSRSEQTDSINRKLMTLRSNIVEHINASLGHGESSERLSSNANILESIRVKENRLAQVNKDIETAGFHTYTITKPADNTKPVADATGPKLVVLDKPADNIEYVPVNSLLIYGIALIAGMFFPFAGWVVRSIRKNSSSRKLLNKEKLSEKLNDIFAVKQID